MKERLTHAKVKKALLKDPEILEAYQNLAEEFQLIREMIYARERAGMTQANVAKAMKTTTSAISRLESLYLEGRPSPSFATLKKYAHVLGYKVCVKFVREENFLK